MEPTPGLAGPPPSTSKPPDQTPPPQPASVSGSSVPTSYPQNPPQALSPAPEPGISQTYEKPGVAPPPPPFNPDAPLPGIVVGGSSAASTTPVPTQADTIGQPAASAESVSSPPQPPGRGPNKKRLTIAGSLAALLIIVLGWYFGYHQNPSVIYSQSLKNTGKGYNKLLDYADEQTKSASKSYTGSGTFKAAFEDFKTDGKIGFKSDGDNGELTFDVGVAATRVNADIRTIKSTGDTPDVYVKVADIKGLGSVLGVPELDANLAKLDDNWVVIDHTLIDNFTGVAADQASASDIKGPTRNQLLDEARAFGKVNQQYLFSTSKNKAVTKIVKKHGRETVDGHKTYHYTVAFQKDNVKKYILAQKDALKTSKLDDWLKQNKYDKEVYSSFDDAAKSTKDIKDSDTFDIWMDTGKRIVYKIRIDDSKKDPAHNYTDIGLDYKGGDSFPFFIGGKYKDSDLSSDFLFTTTVNTKTNNINFKASVKESGSGGGSFTANFDLKPGATNVKIDKPAGAKPLAQVLSELGYGDLVSQLSSGSSIYAGQQDKAKDSKRQVDINSLQTQVEAFFTENGYYPSLADMNNSAWLAKNMKSLDQNALSDPDSGGSKTLVAAPRPNAYAYLPGDSTGKSCESSDIKCAKYKLTATLSSGAFYSKENLE